LSTLTKILIVLLTLSTIFLCGITVTYVGTATNYKKLYTERNSKIQSLTKDNDYKAEQINSLEDKVQNTKDSYEKRIESLDKELATRGLELETCQRTLSDTETRLKDNAAILADSMATVATNNKLRQEAESKRADLEKIKQNNEKQIKELNDRVLSLETKIDLIETEKRQLVEDKTQIQNRLDQLLQVTGQRAFAPENVTLSTDKAKPAPPMRALDLEGVINEVKLQDSLASISKGSADGVKDGMRFHVLRDNKYICDIVIFSVDADQSSGFFELAGENQPRPGDIVKTNF
jgi:chromosome segregation ATPase